MISPTTQHISVQGGTGGAGGSGGNEGGVGGLGEGPQVTLVSEAGVINHMTFHNVPSFTGRQETLDEIHQYFAQAQGLRKVFILHGLGGSGKSQIAFKFVQQAQASKRFSKTFFIDATSDQTAETDLKLLAPATSEATAQEGLLWLSCQQEPWLLVLDNADDPKSDISKFFPPCTFGNILITTRNPELCIHGVDSKVSDMTLDDAKELLLRLAGKKAIGDGKEEVATAIVKELHCFALAVTQAGGYIHACSNLSKYLALYKSSREKLLQHAEVQGQGQYGLAVYATWDLSYQKLSTGSKTFLHICSQLHHQNIREEMFQKAALSEEKLEDLELQETVDVLLTKIGGANQGWNPLVFLEITRELQSYSLIEHDIVDDSYSVHPLIRDWSGTTITKEDMSKCVLTIIGLSVPWKFQLKDYTYRHSLIYHIAQHFDKFKCNLDAFAASRIALVLYETGLYQDAEVLQVAVVERRKCTLGNEHHRTLRSMGNLALIYEKQGRWGDAKALQVAVVERRECTLGNEHPDTLTSMVDLASTYRKQGRLSDAESLEVIILEASSRVLGNEHPDMLTTMANLAATFWNQGRWSDAERLEVIVLDASKQMLGKEHRKTLTSMANLAATYWKQGRWSDAESLEVTVLDVSKRVLGKEHRHTLTSMANLAAIYRKLGRLSDAESLGVPALEARQRVLGNEHPDTLTSMANLAAIYRRQSRWSDAESLEVTVLDVSKRVRGKKHRKTLTSMANLAATYRELCQWRDAESLGVTALEARMQVLGAQHPGTLTSMKNLAATYRQQGKWSDAENLDVIVLDTRKRVLGDKHPDTLTSIAHPATTYREQGQEQDAQHSKAPHARQSVQEPSTCYYKHRCQHKAHELGQTSTPNLNPTI
ncbi:hypothetical protein R3P38DRAFT_2779729 [Favolaschia claudopus]|uniref:Kinesin light chain n=1 Tax=Favolaschia claudopus TaxID=2862362 RepID=A0AAW0BD98_9AGAR